ncbi:dolichyl-phosphate beta-glucosyltransferase [Starmerella bacillaris]|uniref:dolichyl-phosphate beta-glucosyltransferase n=1 Tax=Starmerella bacillaris TaxID=1247836 RepID=A0AAV5RMI8_STABA|nr:dolichyl-phosphate beta-glucosyltransferase [Starmerella bacillaris]
MASMFFLAKYTVPLAIALVLLAYVLAAYFSNTPRAPFASELEFSTVDTTGELPTIFDAPTTEVSVVVPCYNEEMRLPELLKAAVPYLQENFKRWEILIVDDGSKDRTVEIALNFARDNSVNEKIRCCKFEANRGKGGAVTHGMNHASGEYILFADADNASDFSSLKSLLEAVKKSTESGDERAVAIGSRAHLVHTQAVIKRSALRNALMRCFHLLVYFFGVRTIRDTQCGFKLFTRPAAAEIFPYMHTEGWIFDVEALLIAQRKNIPVNEIAISWHEVTGSKIDLARDSIQMAIDLVAMRFAYLFGIYNDTELKRQQRKNQ